jgi:uncharacterized damage-inducible protein DinB
MQKTEIQNLIDTLSHTFEKNAWHGPAVLEALEDLSTVQAEQRIGNSHSIIELIAHMTAWRNFVCEKLEDNAAYDIVIDDMNFPNVRNLQTAIKELKTSQRRLLKLLKQTPVEKLEEKVPGRPFKFKVMLNGIIHHDLYHTGQIVLLKKYHSEQL